MAQQLTVYIAGPMRGYPQFNFPLFFEVEEELQDAGFRVVNPARMDREIDGFDPKRDAPEPEAHYMRRDIPAIARCDLIALLPGWEGSEGVRKELTAATWFGIPAWPADVVLDAEGMPSCDPVQIAGVGCTTQPRTETTGEVRVTDPTTGGQKGAKPQRYDLIPPEPLHQLAVLYGWGAGKYEARNFERGYRWGLSFAAMMRHAWAWWGGEDCDTESGLSHMVHVAWHAFAMVLFETRNVGGDDRPNATQAGNSAS